MSDDGFVSVEGAASMPGGAGESGEPGEESEGGLEGVVRLSIPEHAPIAERTKNTHNSHFGFRTAKATDFPLVSRTRFVIFGFNRATTSW